MTVVPAVGPAAPPGVDPDVLARINAFMRQTSLEPSSKCAAPIDQNGNASVRKRPGLVRREAATTDVGEKKQNSNTAQEEQDEEGRGQLTQGAYDWIKKPHILIDTNALDTTYVCLQRSIQIPQRFTKSSEQSPTLSIPHIASSLSINYPEYDEIGREILARATYPSRPPSRPPPLPPRLYSKTAQVIGPPTLTSLLSMLYVLFLSFFMLDDKPEVIEHSVRHVKRRHRVRCEMMVVEANNNPKISEGPESEDSEMHKQVVFMAHLLVEDGNTETLRVVPITAKPRRVRGILRDAGIRYGVEDVYEREIKCAMRRLCAPGGA
ncbi:hypothetical protein BKA63DRAFT_575925 [Paraphoma chrysanthemicola]|nr:hypothetical protein BKA63DRAFT_575925 [Paraphoma chrysanthemicola]